MQFAVLNARRLALGLCASGPRGWRKLRALVCGPNQDAVQSEIALEADGIVCHSEINRNATLRVSRGGTWCHVWGGDVWRRIGSAISILARPKA